MGSVWSWLSEHLLAPAIVAVVFSWILLLTVEGHRARRDALSKQLETVRSDLLALWEVAVEYWSRPGNEDTDAVITQKIYLAEQDMRYSAMELATGLSPYLEPPEMVLLIADVTHAVTSGAFGEPDRLADVDRLAELRSAIVVMRERLLAARNARMRANFRLY